VGNLLSRMNLRSVGQLSEWKIGCCFVLVRNDCHSILLWNGTVYVETHAFIKWSRLSTQRKRDKLKIREKLTSIDLSDVETDCQKMKAKGNAKLNEVLIGLTPTKYDFSYFYKSTSIFLRAPRLKNPRVTYSSSFVGVWIWNCIGL
jgi:hypothetical protein